jgi:transcriptional regulator with XRE-family HTH domain
MTAISDVIRQLRESRMMSRPQLARHSKISRSHLFHIEQGDLTPGIGTLEKISRALDVGMGRLLAARSDSEVLLEDGFIRVAHPFVRRLDQRQRQLLLQTLQAAPRKENR